MCRVEDVSEGVYLIRVPTIRVVLLLDPANPQKTLREINKWWVYWIMLISTPLSKSSHLYDFWEDKSSTTSRIPSPSSRTDRLLPRLPSEDDTYEFFSQHASPPPLSLVVAPITGLLHLRLRNSDRVLFSSPSSLESPCPSGRTTLTQHQSLQSSLRQTFHLLEQSHHLYPSSGELGEQVGVWVASPRRQPTRANQSDTGKGFVFFGSVVFREDVWEV